MAARRLCMFSSAFEPVDQQPIASSTLSANQFQCFIRHAVAGGSAIPTPSPCDSLTIGLRGGADGDGTRYCAIFMHFWMTTAAVCNLARLAAASASRAEKGGHHDTRKLSLRRGAI